MRIIPPPKNKHGASIRSIYCEGGKSFQFFYGKYTPTQNGVVGKYVASLPSTDQSVVPELYQRL
jgi:hypothetical protein